MTNLAVWKAKVTLFSNALGETDDGIIFPDQCQGKGKEGKKEQKVSNSVKVWSFDLVFGGSSLPQ